MIKKIQQLVSDNRFFFTGYLLLLIVGGLILLNIEKGDAILFFNDHRSVAGDLFFRIVTQCGEVFGYILVMVFMAFYKLRSLWLVPLTGAVVMVLSKTLKEIFQQSRPIAWFREQELFETLNVIVGEPLLVGASSFPSGHSMSAFALYGLIAFIMPRKKGVGLALLFFAMLIALSRVYLIHHFFRDIYVGSIIGVLIAMLVYGIGTMPRFNDGPVV